MPINPRRRSATIGAPRPVSARRFVLPAMLAASLSLTACGSSTDATPANNTVPTVSSTSESVSAPASTDTSNETSSETSTETTDSSTESSTESTDTSTDTSTETSTESTDTSTDTSTESTDTSTETSTEKPTSTAQTTGTVAAGKDGVLTKPGTKLAFGKTAIVEFQTGAKGDSYYQHGTLQVTVTKIVKGDPKIFDKLDNKADFKGLVPYYVYSQDTIVSYQGKADGNPPNPAIIDGVTKDGHLAGKAISFSGGPAECDSNLFGGVEIGLKATKCTITLAKKDGSPVFGAAFSGDDDVYPDSDKNPYDKRPVLWLS